MSSNERTSAGRITRPSRTAARTLLLAAVLMLASLAGGGAAAETRVALVIGNAQYATSRLANPNADAALMARALKGVGFEVTTITDANLAAMQKAVLEFGRRLRTPGSVGLFYYAGHGVQVDGQNYLVPVGADIKDTEEVALQGINLNELLRTMERSSSTLNIAILDACRDNPYETNARSASRGLAAVRAPTGTFIAYATAPGEVAYDGDGANSPYTAALAAEIGAAGVPIEEVFRRTRRRVLEATSNRQTPWEHSSLTAEFFFKPKTAEPEISTRPPLPGSYGLSEARLSELRDWERIKDSKDGAAMRKHLERYPDGVFAELISVRLAKLDAQPNPWSWIFTSSADSPARSEAERLYEEAVRLDTTTRGGAGTAEAVTLYRQAADLGLAAAMFQVARAYDHGRGVAKDASEAARWYRLAADKDHAGATAALGTMYEFGEGVTADLGEATRLYKKAADAGDLHGLTSLAYLMAQGKGSARDAVAARRLYNQAAERGHPRAMHNLALMLLRGDGGPVDRAGAVRMLQQAADAGHAGALRELAFLYDEGRGVARKPDLAAKYLLSAFRAGNADARRDVLLRSATWSYATRREIQKALARDGLYAGHSHGLFDAKTKQALEKYAER